MMKQIHLCLLVLVLAFGSVSAATKRLSFHHSMHTYTSADGRYQIFREEFPFGGPAVDNLETFSFYCWVRVDLPPQQGDKAVILSRGGFQELFIDNEGRLSFRFQGDNPDNFMAKSLPLGRWTFVAVSFSTGKQSVTMFINDEATEIPSAQALSPISPAAAGAPLIVGQGQDHQSPFDGAVAYIYWSNEELTPERAKELYANPPEEVAERLAVEGTHPKRLGIYPLKALSEVPAFPDDDFRNATPTDELAITLAQDEYEPGAVALQSTGDEELDLVTIKFIQPVNADGVALPDGAVDLKYVKCWFQAGTGWYDISPYAHHKALVPELLLNDPELVTVDLVNGTQYVKLGGVDGKRAMSLTAHTRDNNGHYPTSEFDIRDAETLQPFGLYGNRIQELFVTVHAPAGTEPGDYLGSLEFWSEGELLATLRLKVTVLPFQLATPRLARDLDAPFLPSVYYLSGIHPDGESNLNPYHRNEAQVAAELKDLAAHGITYALNDQLQVAWNDLELFRKMLRMRKAAGMADRPLLLLGPEANFGRFFDTSEENLAAVREMATAILQVVEEELGHREVYFYGVDEAQAEGIAAQKPFWDIVHELGGKMFVSDNSKDALPVHQPGDLLDLVIRRLEPSRELTALRHANGGLLMAYGIPQSGPENPEVFRRNYGLALWQLDYDGFATYCYASNMGCPWNDFDHIDFRDHNFVYPTTDGVIDTLAWEGYREAVDDIRYASTLALAIRENPNHPQAAEAKAFLETMDPSQADLDALRAQIIAWILKLQTATP